jgi:DNA invertase Pin-like site-specific DNA recombinase
LYTPPFPKPVIGYVRVSTRHQLDRGQSLDAQVARIRQYVLGNGGDLRAIYGDQASGMGTRAHTTNAELHDALKMARDIGGMLVVTDVSRLGRSTALSDVLEEYGVNVFSLDDGRTLSPKDLLRRLERAQASGESIRRRTRRSLARVRSKGKKLGNPTSLRRAQAKGAISSAMKSDALTESVMRVLQRHDPGLTMSMREAARLLNADGLLTGKGKEWSKTRVRRHLERARARLAATASD